MYSWVVCNRFIVISFSLILFLFLFSFCLPVLCLVLLSYAMRSESQLLLHLLFAMPCNAMLCSAMYFMPGYIVCYTMSFLSGGEPLLWHAEMLWYCLATLCMFKLYVVHHVFSGCLVCMLRSMCHSIFVFAR